MAEHGEWVPASGPACAERSWGRSFSSCGMGRQQLSLPLLPRAARREQRRK